ncbi:MAG TPA: phosphoglucosamine mutase [Edaphocola sp.]|nr:phosphoglucosamine mutase [Edaphocola sp.]
MSLIKSISGIRGTIGGKTGDNLSPVDIVKFTSAYGSLIKAQNKGNLIVVGRDGRISGNMVKSLVTATLQGLGLDVLDLDFSTTPTVEMAVVQNKAAGGIILTASHNPKEWNALKLLDHNGEFVNAAVGQSILEMAEKEDFLFAEVGKLGHITLFSEAGQQHIDAILAHPLVDVQAIKDKNLKVVLDPVNSTGAIFVPQLLSALGVEQVTVINGEVTGQFAHNPEPLPENLQELCSTVVKINADLGIAVDPDVDRLCFVSEDGSLFGEEYTLVAVADYVLAHHKGNTVSNLSSTRALRDITEKHGGAYFPSAVGEVNVVHKMKEKQAVIGGEGNGGVIFPDLHYGRDALIGIALFLTHLVRSDKSMAALRRGYPDYYISKNKIALDDSIDLSMVFEKMKTKYKQHPINTEDGLKIEFDKDWVHLRSSNTEPIIRIYAESNSAATADNIANRIMEDIREIIR